MKISPIVVCDEKDAFRGSIRNITPPAARIMPMIFAVVSYSNPAIEPTVSAKTGIKTAKREVLDALVSESPEIKNN